MLAGVLLHMIQTARPIDSSFYSRANFGRPSLNHMQHAVLFIVDTFDHAQTVERAGVAGLTAAGGIKSRAIERDGSPAADALGFVMTRASNSIR